MTPAQKLPEKSSAKLSRKLPRSLPSKFQVTPRKQPSQARSQVMVDAILDATTRVLVRGGYAKANTNAIAETAGISVGSLYQYFPNKESLVAALHKRHVLQMHATFAAIIGDPRPRSLKQAITDMVRAGLDAHRVEPTLHKVLETEVPHLDCFEGHQEADRKIGELLAKLVRNYRSEIKLKNLDLAAFIVGKMVHALIHAAVIDPPADIGDAAIERETIHAVLAYLSFAPPLQLQQRSLKPE